VNRQGTTRPLPVNQRAYFPAAGILQRKCACGQLTGGGLCEGCKKADGMLQRHPAASSGTGGGATIGVNQPANTTNQASPEAPATIDILNRAAAESGHSIHEPLRSRLGEHFAQDFTQVRVHSGSASADAAQRVSARAYTLGTDIHLGREAHGLSGRELDQLLAHEAVHTVQQGGHAIAPHAALSVSNPADAAEQEAERLAESITSASAKPKPSRSLALRGQIRASMPGQIVSRSVSPHIQRDLVGKHPTREGEFDLNLKTESHPGAKNGMSGTIKFTANDKAPDSDKIRILQVARDEDLTTGKEYVWTGGEANRNKIMTTSAPGIDPGFFVDVMHAGNPPHTKARTPRTKKADVEVSPYYIEDYGKGGGNQDGKKKGKTIEAASIWDYPGSSSNRRFSFETLAKASDTGHVYATVMWGFTISDAANGKVDHERAVGRNVTLSTTDKAIDNFNKFYRNKGASTAP
jgi:hypothetical protein